MRDKVVYIYRDTNGNSFYVGKGSMGRAYSLLSRSKEFLEAIKSYESIRGIACYPEIVGRYLTNGEALDLEGTLIDLIGLDNLVNKTRGDSSTSRDNYDSGKDIKPDAWLDVVVPYVVNQ